MQESKNLNQIIVQLQQFSREEQLYIMQQLSLIIKESDEQTEKPTGLSTLNGLGSEFWQDIDLNKYIEEERQW